MPFTCLPQSAAKAFKNALKNKDIQIADLLRMSTEDRTKVFESFAGKDAKSVNQLFEEKLVLKNKVMGLKNFISKMTQEGKYDPAKKAGLEQLASEYRQQQQNRIFNPSEEQAFLNDLADSSIGTHITRQEAKNVFDLSAKADENLKEFDGKKWSSPEAAKKYGDSKFAYEAYTEALKEDPATLRELVKEALDSFKENFKSDPPKAIIDLILKAAKGATDASISTVASLDNSFIGRQGLLTLFTEPKRFLQSKAKGVPYHNIWWNGASKSFTDFYKTLKGFDQKSVLMSELYSQPDYINGDYNTAKLLPKNEEQYPTSLPGRIPGAGRVFKASEAAFEGSAVRMRTQLYSFTKQLMERNGVEMNKEQVESVGKLVNSMTSRGSAGSKGGSSLVRLVLWAPKMLRAHWDVLTAHTGQKMSVEAKKEAALNLVSYIAATAAIMTIANALKPGSAELDPRSSDFGKIKIGSTRFDYTGGAASLVVLASRIATQSSKSTTTGIVKKLNTGAYGSQTTMDVLVNFLEGKTTPAVGAVISVLKNADYKGQKPTASSIAQNIALPITLQNILQLKDDHSVSSVVGVLLDGLGINSTTYTPTKTDWTSNPGVELQAFQKSVGDQKFKAANNDYNTQVASFMSSLDTNPKYKALTDAQKQAVITKKKEDIKTAVMKQYGFTYKRPKSTPTPKI